MPAFDLEDVKEIVRAVPLSLVRLVRGVEVRTSVHGRPFCVDTRDNIVSFDILFRRTWEPSETALFRSVLKAGDRVVDIGGHIGYYAVLFGTIVGHTGRVLSIEPDPENAALLRKNITLNGFDGVVTVLEAAAGERSSRAQLHRADSRNRGDHRMYSAGAGRSALEVNVVAVDDCTAGWDRVDIVKMDIQGYEPHALAGMRATLQRNQHIVLVSEFWPHGMTQSGGDPLEFLGELRAMGFAFYTMARGGRLQLTSEQALLARHSALRSFTDIVCARAAAVVDRLHFVLI